MKFKHFEEAFDIAFNLADRTGFYENFRVGIFARTKSGLDFELSGDVTYQGGLVKASGNGTYKTLYIDVEDIECIYTEMLQM